MVEGRNAENIGNDEETEEDLARLAVVGLVAEAEIGCVLASEDAIRSEEAKHIVSIIRTRSIIVENLRALS